jgi:hypothetical protein
VKANGIVLQNKSNLLKKCLQKLALPLAVIRSIRMEAGLWKAAGLFRAELTLVDRWRLGE